jgi:hypothetical protein
MMHYESVTTSWSSTPKNGKVHGQRNTVRIENGKGVKRTEALNAAGSVIETNTKHLKQNEIASIANGTFVPGLWSDCGLKCMSRNAARKQKKTKTRRTTKKR